MKKVLLIGGSHRDIPLIKTLKNLGFFVITVGYKDYYIGHRYADVAIKEDFSDESKLRRIIDEHTVDYIVPGSGDLPYILASKISHLYKIGNLDDPETAYVIHTKDKFKTFCLEHDIPTPKGVLCSIKDFSEKAKDLEFPLIVKPVNLSGGKGISVVRSEEELKQAIRHASVLSGRDIVVVEEFLKGRILAFSTIIKSKKVVYSFVAEEFTAENSFFIQTTIKTSVDPSLKMAMTAIIEKIAKLLNLKDGLIHAQFIEKDGKVFVLELTRRIPGDLFPTLIDISDGVNYTESVINGYLGREINIKRQGPQIDNAFRYNILAIRSGIYKGTKIKNPIEVLEFLEIKDRDTYTKVGEQIAILIGVHKQTSLEQISSRVIPVIE